MILHGHVIIEVVMWNFYRIMPIGKVYLVQGFTKVSTNAFLVDVGDDDVINILISSTTLSKIVEALDLIIFNLLILEKVTCICSIKF